LQRVYVTCCVFLKLQAINFHFACNIWISDLMWLLCRFLYVAQWDCRHPPSHNRASSTAFTPSSKLTETCWQLHSDDPRKS
jgi:hypothetical protein